MKVELSEREIRDIGENRWIGRHWKKTLLPWLVALLGMIGVGILLPEGMSIWLRGLCLAPAVIIFVALYTRWLVKMLKAGRIFLEGVKVTQEVN